MLTFSSNYFRALFPLILCLNFWQIKSVDLSIKDHLNDKPESVLKIDKPADKDGKVWALLVAGSNGWYNYRHQADVCHAYHILRNHGIPEENIVTMMYDDIANNTENPHPGKIFNHPQGKDVYAGVPIDYTGDSVNPENFLAILRGDAASVSGGNKRVLESSNKDNVFVYFSDHGTTGIIGFPNEYLHVKPMQDTLIWMRKNDRYKKLTFYLETCESGSMFQYRLFKSYNIYALTAANAVESSYATYCDNNIVPNNCLGDEFSVNWMEHSDRTDLRQLTLEEQFKVVKQLTENSHVMRFGNRDIGRNFVSEFQGNLPFKEEQQKVMKTKSGNYTSYPSFEVPLAMLKLKHQKAGNKLFKIGYQREIDELLKKRKYLEEKVSLIVGDLVKDKAIHNKIMTDVPEHLNNVDCHHEVVRIFHTYCFKMTEYVLKYGKVLANLCNNILETEKIKNAILEQCAKIEDQGIIL